MKRLVLIKRSYLILAILFLLVLSLSISAIWLGDDLFFGFSFGAKDWCQRVDSLGDIFKSQSLYYMYRNGRFVTHCIVQFFCGMGGQTCFALCNALVWVAFVVMICLVSGINWRERPLMVFVAVALSFVCLRTQYTPPCQINYIWAMTAALAVVYWFMKSERLSAWKILLLVIFSFLAGWGQESFSTGIAAAMWIYVFMHFKSVKPQQWCMLAAFTLGMLCLCLAPGNFTKIGTTSSIRVTPVAMIYYSRAPYLLLAFAVALLLAKKASLKTIARENMFWVTALVILLLFNIAITVYCNRQLFGIEVISIIIFLRLLNSYGPIWKQMKAAGTVALIGLVLFVSNDDFATISKRTDDFQKIRLLYLASTDGVVYCDIDDDSFFYHDEDPMSSFNYWTLLQLRRVWLAEGYAKELEWRPTEIKKMLGKQLDSQVIKLGENKNTYVIIQSKSEPACDYKILYDWKYGPMCVCHCVSKPSAEKLFGMTTSRKIEDTYFNAVVWRQNDAFLNCTDVQMIK